VGTPPGVRWSFGVPVRVVGVEVAGHQKGLAGSREAEGVVRGVGGAVRPDEDYRPAADRDYLL